MRDKGFALLLVLWIVTILAAAIMAFVGSVAAESRAAAAEREALVAEQLAISGQEMVPFLAARGFGSSLEDLAGLPVSVITPAFHYQVQFPAGTVDIYLESDNGKINAGTARRELLQSFFGRWDAARGASIADSIMDWRDADSDPEPGGAEKNDYAGLGYGPRNTVLGIGDMPLIRGLRAVDFVPRLRRLEGSAGKVVELVQFLTTGPVGTAINPNFAPEMVLQAVPGLTEMQVEAILEARRAAFLDSAKALEAKTGILQGSTVSEYFVFNRGGAPAVLTVARPNGSSVRRSLRRVFFAVSVMNPVSGILENDTQLGYVERNVFPDFVRK